MSVIDYKVEQDGNTYIIKMSGAINAQTLPQYRKVVDQIMAELDTANRSNLNFIVDYGGIEDIDSTALANILDRLKNDVRSDHKVVFINVPEKFQSIVELHKMEKSIKIYRSNFEVHEQFYFHQQRSFVRSMV